MSCANGGRKRCAKISQTNYQMANVYISLHRKRHMVRQMQMQDYPDMVMVW